VGGSERLPARAYEVGLIQQTPIPQLSTEYCQLSTLARRAWSLKRSLDTINETSHAFVLPLSLLQADITRPHPNLPPLREGTFETNSTTLVFDPPAIEAELTRIQAKIDDIAFDLYGFSEADREMAMSGQSSITDKNESLESDEDDEEDATGNSPLTTKVISNNETTKTKMNYPQNHEQSPRQAGAWRSQKERQAPAWPLDGMFFIGYHLTTLHCSLGRLA